MRAMIVKVNYFIHVITLMIHAAATMIKINVPMAQPVSWLVPGV
jgi:hypothetical protein